MADIELSKLEVVHNPEKSRFEITLEGGMAISEYQLAAKNMIFTHTEVPEAYEGLGVGNKLAQVGLDYARDHGYKIQALCPFMNAYVRRHKEYHPITWGYET